MQNIYPNSNSNARPVAGAKDARTGHGYGKSQKIPSIGTGIGSERPMGSSNTGIYSEPPAYTDDECCGTSECECVQCTYVDDVDINAFNTGIKYYARTDPSNRADRGSFGHSSQFNNVGLAESILVGEYSMPNTMKGIAPYSHSTLYPKGFDGPPVGAGSASQAFRTTGNYKRTGTQYGTSRAPQNTIDSEEIAIDKFDDIISLDPGERSIIRQKLKILAILGDIDSVEDDEVNNIDNLDDYDDEVLL